MCCMSIYLLSGEFVMLEKVDGVLLRLVHMPIDLLWSARAKTASMYEEQCLAWIRFYIYTCSTDELMSVKLWSLPICFMESSIISDANRRSYSLFVQSSDMETSCTMVNQLAIHHDTS